MRKRAANLAERQTNKERRCPPVADALRAFPPRRDAFAMCRPLESTVVRLATSRQGTPLDMP
jgi:hypothetical protein